MWQETGAVQDAWFEGRGVAAGSYLFIRGNTGYGPHNPNVLFVDFGQARAA